MSAPCCSSASTSGEPHAQNQWPVLLPGSDKAAHEQYSRVITPKPGTNEETEDICVLLQLIT